MMKKRIGNDITFTWHIYRKSGETQTPESFTGKEVEVKLISPLQRPVTIEEVTIATGVVNFTFRGKHQVTLGNYVAVLLENKGEDGMVTLDVVNAVTLVAHSYMEEDGDEGDVIEATSVELESEIGQGIDAYTKAETDALLEGKYDKVDGIRFLAEQREINVMDENYHASTSISPNRMQFEELNGTQSADIWLNGGYLRLNDTYRTSPTGNKIATDLELEDKQDVINDLATIRSGAQAGATAYQKPQAGIPSTDLSSAVQVSLGKADTALQEHQSLAGLVNTGNYNTVSKKIELKHDNNVLAEIDATAFIKDGMVSSVTISNGYLVITFNTDAGKEPISIALTDIFNPANYYDKDNVDGLLAGKVDKITGKGLSANDYTTEEKSKLSDLPTNSQLQLSLEGKANKIPMPPVIHELVISGATQVSDVITLITGDFQPRTYSQIDSKYTNPAVIEFTVNYTGELRFTGKHVSGGILEYIKAYVNGTLVKISAERITSATLKFDVEANDVVKVEFTRYVTGNFTGCIGNLSITSAGVPKDLIDVYNSLASVATSGSYNDLTDKPTIPAAQVQSDWSESDTTNKAYILNKPTIPTVPTNVSAFNNDAGYLTEHQSLSNYVQKSQTVGLLKNDGTVDTNTYLTQHQDISGKANKNEMSVVPGTGADADKTTITLKQGTSATVLTAHQDITAKENVMPITTATGATLTAVAGNYYRLDNVGTLEITLPTIVGATKLQAITFLLVCGSNAVVSFVPQGSETILYQEDFPLEANTTYEVTALWNGSEWTLSRVIYE